MINIIYIGTNKWNKCLETIYSLELLNIIHCFIPDNHGKLFQLCEKYQIKYKQSDVKIYIIF